MINKLIKSMLPLTGCTILFSLSVSCSLEIKPDPDVPTDVCTITFNLSEGETIQSGSSIETVEIGTIFGNANSPTILKSNNIFNGWSFEPEGTTQHQIPFDYVVDGDIDVYPMWVPDTSDDTKLLAFLDGEWFPLSMDSVCTEDEDTKIIIFEQDGEQIKETVDRNEFNYPILVGSDITHILDFFLAHCSNFNSTITFTSDSKLIYIGESFLSCCSSYNETISLPDDVKCIGSNFMGNCEAFNKEFELPTGIQIIGNEFLSDCIKFNQDFTISSSLIYVGENCMIGCCDFTSQLTINCSPENLNVGKAYGWSASVDTAAIYTTGFTVTGTCEEYFRQSFKTIALPGLYRTVR